MVCTEQKLPHLLGHLGKLVPWESPPRLIERHDKPALPKQPHDVSRIIPTHPQRRIERSGAFLHGGGLHRLSERLYDRRAVPVTDLAVQVPIHVGNERRGHLFFLIAKGTSPAYQPEATEPVDAIALGGVVQAGRQLFQRELPEDVGARVERQPGSLRHLIRR